MGSSWFYGYTEEKATIKSMKRGMSIGEYGLYLKGKQRKTRAKKRRNKEV